MAAPEGYKELGKIGISYKGEYSSNTAYERLDAVSHNGSTYLAIKDAPDGAPRDDKVNWMYLAKGFSDDVGESEIAFTEAEELEPPVSGEKINSVFGKVSLAIKNLKTLITLMGTTDIASIGDGTVTGAISDVNGKLFKEYILADSSYDFHQIPFDFAYGAHYSSQGVKNRPGNFDGYYFKIDKIIICYDGWHNDLYLLSCWGNVFNAWIKLQRYE